jgi:hypothetical protein
MAALTTVVEYYAHFKQHKYQLRDNMPKIFIEAFGAARMEYSTTSDKFEMTYHKPGGTFCGALGKWCTK